MVTVDVLSLLVMDGLSNCQGNSRGVKKPVMMEDSSQKIHLFLPNLRAEKGGEILRKSPRNKYPPLKLTNLAPLEKIYLEVSLPTSVSGRFLLFVVDDFRRLRLNTLDIQNLSSHTW